MYEMGQACGDGKRHGYEQRHGEHGQAGPARPIGPGDAQHLTLDKEDENEDECHHPE